MIIGARGHVLTEVDIIGLPEDTPLPVLYANNTQLEVAERNAGGLVYFQKHLPFPMYVVPYMMLHFEVVPSVRCPLCKCCQQADVEYTVSFVWKMAGNPVNLPNEYQSELLLFEHGFCSPLEHSSV